MFPEVNGQCFKRNSEAKAEIYIDDVLLKSKSFKHHLEVADKVMARIAQYNLMIKLEKCHFLRRTVAYLGYELSEEGLLPGMKKIKAVHDFPRPTTVTEIK